MQSTTRVLVVEDEGLYREMLMIALRSTGRVDVVGGASDGAAALALARELRPEVVVMDIDLGPGGNGIEIGRQIRREHPEVGIVLLSNHMARQYLQAIPAREAHGWSYLMKQSVSDLETLVRAVQGAASGLMVVDPRISQGLSPRANGRLNRLTDRQLDVLRLVAEGYNNAAIARRLSLANKSVENYLTAIYQELGIRHDEEPTHPRVRAVLVYLEETRPVRPRRF